MKKGLITVLIIAAVVAGMHFLIVKTLLKSKGNEEKKQPENSKTEETKGQKPLGLPPEKVNNKSPSLKMGTPFSYRKAVNGNITELPQSKDATAGLLVDLDTRTVLWAKNPRKSMPVASMTKMMTALLAFEDMDKKLVTFDTPVKVTSSAAKMGGSQIFMDVKESFSFEDLMKCLMIRSANDAAYLVAEHLSGNDVAGFVRRMNQRAMELRLVGTKFYNPTGLPGNTSAEDNVCSCEGMVFLAERLLQYPDAVKWASTKYDQIRKDTTKPFDLHNHNHLIGVCPGVNGMKTGWIARSGFCITITCERGGRKLACCITGFKTRQERDAFAVKLLNWGYGKPPENINGNPSIDTAGIPPIPK